MKHLRRFSDCKTEQDILDYLIRKTPSVKRYEVLKDGVIKEIWLPKLGSICVKLNGTLDYYDTKLAAIVAARKYHNYVSIKLSLKPIYQF